MLPPSATLLGVLCLSVLTAAAAGTWTSEGTTFAIGLASSHEQSNNAEIIINAEQTAQVTISTSSSSDVLTVPGGWSEHHEVDYSMRVENGLENKGIIITSDLPVSVHVATLVLPGELYGGHTPDSCLVRPLSSTSVEYFLAGYDDFTFHQRPASYYTIVAAEGDTEVDVIYAAGLGLDDEHITLNAWATFTRDTFYDVDVDYLDFTGTRILASKPVAVYSGGHMNLEAPGANTDPKYAFASMPSLFEIGTDYTTFPLHYGGDGGYEVRVIAVANGTGVVIPEFSVDVTLNMGEFYEVDNTQTMFGFHVSCSLPCMAVQYVRTLPEDSTAGILAMHPFLAALIPAHRGTDDLIFTVPTMAQHSPGMRAAMSITVNAFPVTGLYLNGTSLADQDWQPVDGSQHSYATVELEDAAGFYRLYTIEPAEKFTAYLYVLQSDVPDGPAPGFPIGYGGSMSNEGTRFAFALPPSASDVDGELILHARQATTVILTFPFLIYELIDLEANVVTHYQLSGPEWRCTEGIEHKALTLTSSSPFSAHLTNAVYTQDSDPDSTILRPIPESLSDVYIVSYTESSTSAAPMAFYMVVAYEEDTDVVVYKQEGSSRIVLEEFSLAANEVFTKDSYVPSSTQPSVQTTAQPPSPTREEPAPTSAQPPAQTTAQPPAQTTAQPPAQTTAQPPAQTTVQLPAQTTVQLPAQTTVQLPAQTTVQLPAQTTSQQITNSTTENSLLDTAELDINADVAPDADAARTVQKGPLPDTLHARAKGGLPGMNQKNSNDSGDYPSDFTGIFVRASRQVAVYSGHGHAHVNGRLPRHLFGSMPYVKELGWKTYVTVPYHFGEDDAGYIVRVLSVASETRIVVPAFGYDVVHDAGTFYEFDYGTNRQGTTVYCSRGCTVAQYTKEAEAGGSPGQDGIMPFMLVLTPDIYYSRDVFFSSPSWASNASLALSLVVNFYPVDDLYLDGVSLVDLSWQIAPDGAGAFATVPIQPGQRHLYTQLYGHGFAAYVIATLGTGTLSFGYAVSFAGE